MSERFVFFQSESCWSDLRKEGGREGGEGSRQGKREGGREGGREGRKETGKEGGREGGMGYLEEGKHALAVESTEGLGIGAGVD